MPPHIVFVTITNELSLPLKIFTKPNFQTHTHQESLAINQKSLITLTNLTSANRRLNRVQISNLTRTISPRIKEILFNGPLPQSSQPFEFQVEQYRVVVPIEVVFHVRFKLKLIEYDDARKYLRDSGVEMISADWIFEFRDTRDDQGDDDEEALVEVKREVGGGEEEEEEDVSFRLNEQGEAVLASGGGKRDESLENEELDQKKAVRSYKLSGLNVVGDFASCIRVYVN
ncbi:uncharacterized protein LODBEIA_P24410 [Lodderomyces beijingensis]|uniref:Uncharacterized protein n=1 Tax=Lodderomyces beijingensis TaxID=1775926 RepID=A0ABP0ZJA1_9ASCO